MEMGRRPRKWFFCQQEEIPVADPIAPTPTLMGDDARRFVEAAQNPLKAPDADIDSEKIDSILSMLAAEEADDNQE